jgi:hypothetical protein
MASFGWLVAGSWGWFVVRKKYCWLAGGWWLMLNWCERKALLRTRPISLVPNKHETMRANCAQNKSDSQNRDLLFWCQQTNQGGQDASGYTLPSLRTQATIAPQPGQTAQTVILHPTPFLPPDRQGRAREWERTSPEPQAPRSIDHPAMPGPFPLHRLRIARLWKGGGWGRVIFWTQQAA